MEGAVITKPVTSLFTSFRTRGSAFFIALWCCGLICSIVLCPSLSSAFDRTLEQDLQDSLIQSRAIVLSMQNKLSKGESTASDISQLKSAAEKVRISNLLLEERFKLREEKVAALGSKAQSRHQNMIDGYRKALNDYVSLIDNLPSEGTIPQSTIDKLQSLLNELLPKRKRPIIGSLPYKHLNYPAQEPSSAAAIIPAYKGGNKVVSPDDTKSAPEAPISQEIAALARSLNWSPVSIYEYVKNTVEAEWYWGCMKGAEETLHQKSGNDCDQASLLAALLRASGYPTRYVRGTIEFFPDIERAKNLIGIDDPARIAAFFQKAGIPYKPIILGGKIANFQIEHIWVESQIPYANYRGAIIDEHGKVWLGLDTSIKVKGYTYNNPPDILSTMSFSTVRDEYLGLLTASTGSTPFELNQTPLEYLQSRIDSELQTENSELLYADLMRTRILLPEVMNILPSNTQFTLIKATNEYTSIPDELIHKVRFVASIQDTAGSMQDNLLDITLPLYGLSNRQIAISYEPETVEDQEIIDSYGGLDNTPAYLIHLRPVLKINNERIIVGTDGLPMGAEYDLTIEVIGASGDQRSEKTTNTMLVGNLSVIGITSQRAALTPSSLVEEGAKDAERLLYEAANHYIDRWNQAEEELASLLHLTITRPLPAVVTLGGMIDVTYLLDMPHGIEWKGVFVDANLRAIEIIPSSPPFDKGGLGGFVDDRQKTFMQLSSLQGSILENRIFEDDFKVDSISTAKLFQLATRIAQPATSILTIDKTNIDTVLPTLPFDDNIKEDMINAVNQGFELRTPDSELAYEDWTGIGYLKEDPETGESGWMLSGMIAGGMTAWAVDKWNDIAEILQNSYASANTYAGPANYDPASGHSIQKVAATDLQEGTVGQPLARRLQVKVTDSKQNPVPDRDITFTIKAGKGTFDNLATSITVTTNAQGVASARLILGKHTGDNPAYIWNGGYDYSQQVGENIVDAAFPSGTGLITPFTALGHPETGPLTMKALHGDGWWSSVLSFAGFISVSVEDQYANPISNIPVTFTSTGVDPICTTEVDKNYASLVPTDATCLAQSPVWGDCGEPLSTLTVTTSSIGAAAEVILGSVPNATYPIVASAGTSTTFNLHTYEFGNCTGQDAPSNELFITSVVSCDQYGNSINAGKTNSTIPVSAKIYFVREGEQTITETLSCSGNPLSCPKVVGNTTYFTDTNFTSASVSFSGVEGNREGGVFTANYELQPGKNLVDVDVSAAITVARSMNTCAGCNTNTAFDDTIKGKGFLTVYGVNVTTQPIPMLLVDESGYLSKDQTITYTIEPLDSDYKAMTAYVMIYKDGNVVAQIPTETKGQGTATISRGFQFYVNSLYEAEVILNYGTRVEIRGEKKVLPVAQVRVLTDESPAKEVDEIKFGDGSDAKKKKRYRIELLSKAFMQTCSSLNGALLRTALSTGQTATNHGSGYSPVQHPLTFNNSANVGGCSVKISDKDRFIVSNRSTTDLDDLGTVASDTIVLYGGIGNRAMIELGGAEKEIPIEPVGVIVIGIDGLRQDVLYPAELDNVQDGGTYRVNIGELPGLRQILAGFDQPEAKQHYIMLPEVTAIFPSITLASWASIFTGKLPGETGILGNEFFARDLLDKNITWNLDKANEKSHVPDRYDNPAGMITFSSGAFKGYDAFGIIPKFTRDFLIPYQGNWENTVAAENTPQNDGNILMAKTVYEQIQQEVPAVESYFTARGGDATVVANNHYARGAIHWLTWDIELDWGESKILDKASWGKLEDYLGDGVFTGKYDKYTVDGLKRNTVPFSALTVWYLPGLDHEAHLKGMGVYRDYFKSVTDDYISKLTDRLKDLDEFDNKIFIIVADHGMTAMPWNYTVPITNPVTGQTKQIKPETSCSLKLEKFDAYKVQAHEQANNNLHIWELGEILKTAAEESGLFFKVLAPVPIAALFKDKNQDETPYGATSEIVKANVIAALNGPMAHIYLKSGDTWKNIPSDDKLHELAIVLKRMLQESGVNLDIDVKNKFANLISSVDRILIRQDGVYKVFNGFDAMGNLVPPDDIAILPNSIYVRPVERIIGMNNIDRSGDIVLIFKDFTNDSSQNRYTSGVACKAWHGSLSPADSYVPLIVTYPGGNKTELEAYVNNTDGCSTDQGCDGNWRVTDLIQSIIIKQY